VYHYIRNYACSSDSVVYAINVTGISCLANANFSVVPTSTAQYWNAFLAYPYNITGALWTWGDGSSSNTMYTSHQYSAAANYSICLSVTASCGSTATSCYTYNIYKGTDGASNIISIDVLPGKAQLETVLAENSIMPSFMIYPNPNNGEFTLDISALKGLGTLVEIQDLPGKLIWTERIEAGQKQLPMRLNSGEFQKGLYFIKVYLGQTYYTQKLIIH
ncbi:MAG: T9SS type A sorting domain-containing protein, partial [Bacteroidota bacterium]